MDSILLNLSANKDNEELNKKLEELMNAKQAAQVNFKLKFHEFTFFPS
jgi:hypothetical protein